MSDWSGDIAILREARPSALLFLCVANSARSQMAEGIARALAPPGVHVASAGSAPSHVHREAVIALAEIGIDISGQRSKGMDEFAGSRFDAVITLCAQENCPVWLAASLRLHWPLADPSGCEDEPAAFRKVRDELSLRLTALFAGRY